MNGILLTVFVVILFFIPAVALCLPRPKPPGSGKAPRRGAAVRTDRMWRRRAWRILALWTVVLAAYSNSFRAGLVFDSAGLLLQGARIRAATTQNIGLILTGEYWPSSMAAGLYRPLTTLSYLFNYAVLGNGSRPAVTIFRVACSMIP